MLPTTTVSETEASVEPVPAVRWRPGTRIVFRFGALYFTLYVLSTQMLGSLLPLPVGNVPDLGALPPLRTIVEWIAVHVFGATAPLVLISGSGDKTFDWVLVCCLVAISSVGTAAWSWLDRRRLTYVDAHKWFHVFLRFAVGATLVGYGAVKVVPLQMPAPGLTRLLEPFGQFSPMGVLWASVGASRPYEIFAGTAELAAGLLLFVPSLATLGALIALADAIQIFVLNMTYDIPVKLFSFHLVLMSLVLLAPDSRRLFDVLVRNRPTGASPLPPLSRHARRRRLLHAAQLLFGAYIVGMSVYGAVEAWHTYGGGAPKSPLYGIWTVDRMTIDGELRPPTLDDGDRWRRVLFDSPRDMSYQHMNDTFTRLNATVDEHARRIVLAGPPAGPPRGSFTYVQPTARELVLDGEIGARRFHLEMTLVDPDSFPLVSRGFHWVQEYPFNR